MHYDTYTNISKLQAWEGISSVKVFCEQKSNAK